MTVIERKGFTYSSEGSHQQSRKSKMINLNSNIPLGHSTLFGQKQFAEWSDINFKGCTVWVLDTTLTNLTIGPLPNRRCSMDIHTRTAFPGPKNLVPFRSNTLLTLQNMYPTSHVQCPYFRDIVEVYEMHARAHTHTYIYIKKNLILIWHDAQMKVKHIFLEKYIIYGQKCFYENVNEEKIFIQLKNLLELIISYVQLTMLFINLN